MKPIVILIEAYKVFRLRTNFIQNSAVKVKSLSRGNYWESSVWISTWQVNY